MGGTDVTRLSPGDVIYVETREVYELTVVDPDLKLVRISTTDPNFPFRHGYLEYSSFPEGRIDGWVGYKAKLLFTNDHGHTFATSETVSASVRVGGKNYELFPRRQT